MWAGVWTNTINVSLNTLFVFGFRWGVVGIALSTVLGRLGGLAYALIRAAAHERARRAAITGDLGPPDPAPWRAMLRLALPSAAVFGLTASEGALVNALLAAAPHATEAIAAYSIYSRVLLFMLQPVIATSVAVLPFAARRFGQADGAGIRRGMHETLAAAALYASAVVGPLMLVLRAPLADWLAESEITARYTSFALGLVPLACLAGAPFLLCRPAFDAMHRPRPGLAVALLRYVGLTAPLAWAGIVVARRLELPSLYGLVVAGLVVAALSSLAIYVWLRRAVDELSS